VVVRDGLAYLGIGPRVVIVDVRDPLAPQSIDDIVTSGFARRVHLDGYELYIAHTDGLSIANVRLPDASHFEAELPLGDVLSVHQHGAYAFAVTTEPGEGRLHVVDVSEPSRARQIAIHVMPFWAVDVHVADDVAHLAMTYDGLLTVDVSDPAQPREVGKLTIAKGATRVHVADGHAYLAREKGGLVVAAVDDPASPLSVGIFDSPGDIEAVHAQPGAGFVFGLRSREEALWSIDVRATEADPILSGPIECHEGADDVFADGDRLIVAGTVSDIWDVSRPGQPQRLGRWRAPVSGYASVHAFAQVALITVADRVSPFESMLFVVDVADPSRPEELGRVRIPGRAADVVEARGHAYVAAGDAGLRIVDVRDPAQPLEVGSVKTLAALAVAARDTTLLVLTRDTGLHIFDVSVPEDPDEIGHVPLEGQSRVDVDGRFAYTSGTIDLTHWGLTAIDLRDPRSPAVVDRRFVPGYAYGVRAVDGLVHLGSLSGGLSVLRLEPVAPVTMTPTPTATTGPTPTHSPVAPAGRWPHRSTGCWPITSTPSGGATKTDSSGSTVAGAES
jgi:hypothetical protein